MLGAIIGDIAGSRFERINRKSKEFTLLNRAKGCRPTDDSIMTLAVAQAILRCGGDMDRLGEATVASMQTLGRQYPGAGYGGKFRQWLRSEDPQPYNSFGNGAAMRVSPCGFAAATLDEAIELADRVTEVTHNHPEGMKAAEVVAGCIFLARTGSGKEDLRDYIVRTYHPLDFTLDGIRDGYRFNETCQGSVPQALEAFLEAEGFEDAVRCAVSIGGDSDTIAAIAGSIAEAYYGIPFGIRGKALKFLDETQLEILTAFERLFPPPPERENRT